MRRKYLYLLFFSLTLGVGLNSFTETNPYFVITNKDVQFETPLGFPAQVYDFKENPVTPQGFVLGRKLFYDPILSRDSSVSCAFCHQRIAAFAHIDHTLSHGLNGTIGNRNVPPLQNLIWQQNFMWDGGINHLDIQPLAPLTNEKEMGETLESVLHKLQRNNSYHAEFKDVFNDTVITGKMLLKALAQFTGLMITANSKYDRYVKGEEAYNEHELKGLQLFRSHCNNCHKEPLFTDNTFRSIGLKPDSSLADSGRMRITGVKSDYMKFKVPGLRNIEMTYPYMHDGRFRTLQQVLKHYATGNFFTGYDNSIEKNVGLTSDEQGDIITFLKTLTDQTFLHDRRFADPNFR